MSSSLSSSSEIRLSDDEIDRVKFTKLESRCCLVCGRFCNSSSLCPVPIVLKCKELLSKAFIDSNGEVKSEFVAQRMSWGLEISEGADSCDFAAIDRDLAAQNPDPAPQIPGLVPQIPDPVKQLFQRHISRCRPDCVAYLFGRLEAQPNRQNQAELMYHACINGDRPVLQLMLTFEWSFDVDKCLHDAIQFGRRYPIQTLLNRDARCDWTDSETGDSLLHLAIRSCSGALKCDVEWSAQRIIDESNALQQNYLTIVQYLVQQVGLDVNAKNSRQETPLHLACSMGINAGIVHFLCDQQAQIEALDCDLRTPLHHIAKNIRDQSETVQNERSPTISIVRALVNRGANVEARDTRGFTPLHVAAEQNTTLAIVALIQAGANVNARTTNGSNPLHVAAYYGSLEAAKLLRTCGASIAMKNKSNRTPSDTAKYSPETNYPTVELFLSPEYRPASSSSENDSCPSGPPGGGPSTR